MVRGFAKSNKFVWTPASFEGAFRIDVIVKNMHAGTFATTSLVYNLTSRLVQGAPAVNTTNHPLVALFSAPACRIPNSMLIRFTPSGVPAGGISTPMTTNLVPCRFDVNSTKPDATSMNFYVAGMYPNTGYQMHFETYTPGGTLVVKQTPDLTFTTGALPNNLSFPAFSASGSTTSPESIILHNVITIPVNGHIYTSAATDLAGNILWYAPIPPTRTERGGNSWGFVPGADNYVQGIQESDLAGNPILMTTVGAINEQLTARGVRPITAMHHEVRRIYTPNGALPNGYILTIGSTEQVSTTAQGGTPQKPVDILGDMLIVLDQNMNVVWTWDAFNFLDINQPAILGETCAAGGAGCEPFQASFTSANDWLHSNDAQYQAYDGNITISMRHQDVILKVAFNNGAGDGHIIWKLGNGPIGGPGGTALPSFTLFTNNTGGGHDLGYPWFSHQHDPEFEFGGHLFNGFRVMTLFDNGNTRQAVFDAMADSRCQILAVNETTMIANLNTNADVGNFSFAVGEAQMLSNGSLSCDSGFIGGFAHATTDPLTTTVEALQNGNVVYTLRAAEDSYRTFRMLDLYTPINP